MAAHSRFSLSLALATATLALALVAPLAAHHYLKHDFYIYDIETADYVFDATVEVTWPAGPGYLAGSQEAVTEAPHGNIQLRLPGELQSAQVVVTAAGYCTFDEAIELGGRPHVGGRGIWIALWPCGPRP
jgi:hypothetical protein